jgi:hypothetical protein
MSDLAITRLLALRTIEELTPKARLILLETQGIDFIGADVHVIIWHTAVEEAKPSIVPLIGEAHERAMEHGEPLLLLDRKG